MKKHTLILAIAALMTFGCGSSDAPKADQTATATPPAKTADAPAAEKPAEAKSLVGNWFIDADKPDGANFDLELHPDKTLLYASSQKLKVQDKEVNFEIVMHGTWSNDDKELTVTFTDVKLNGVPPEVAKSQEEPLKAGLNKPTAGAYTWKGDKEVEFTIGGQTQTYKLSEKK